jgi:hypothetical protein
VCFVCLCGRAVPLYLSSHAANAANASNASNPFPNARNISTTPFADGGPNVGVVLNYIANALPDLLATVAPQF